ncbi:MFS family permease [Kineococcus radiotolerans]|uniref:MFS family permease n=1 Tax=Kineococcus radiotolerans TaxID=131568 RepID=A0A7W4XWU2_KINRA|nr:MFS transporter [Kineococcus radiotolerans]MBB2900544.1 MFS family permease [Kineococcus radiotolerans]
MPNPGSPREVPWRSMAAVYAPAALFSTGQGALLPVLPLTARDLGASVAVSASLVALLGVGQVAGALPAGALVTRVGEQRAMLLAALVSALALAGVVLAPDEALLAGCVLALGLAAAVWSLARQSFLTAAAPVHLRARALSTLGGVGRIGTFAGPFAGAGGSALLGLRGAYVVAGIAVLLAAAAVVVLPDPGAGRPAAGPAPTTREVLRSHARLLATLGVAALAVQAVRQSRQTVLPLWCEHVGLDATTTSLVAGVSGAVDMLLFYPAGSVMDRLGRAAVGVPSMLVLALGHVLLPFAHTAWTVAAVGVVLGFGNGMGAGLVMTLGADAAPPGGRAVFLGVWRLVTDAGAASGPLLVGALAGAGSLVLATGGVAVLALAAAAGLFAFVPRGRNP